MRAKEFGAWRSRDMEGGRRKSGDQFNKSFKGEWPPKRPEEYASRELEEYHSYPEIKDQRTEQDEQQNNTSQQSNQNQQSKKTNKQQRSPSQLARNIVSRVVAVSVGAVVVASSYEAMGGELPFSLPFSILSVADITADEPAEPATPDTTPAESDPGKVSEVLSKNWIWSEDHQTAELELSDQKGVVVAKIPATVQIVLNEATCNAEGSKTYEATAKDEKTTYSDSYSEVLPPLGHSFDSGKTVVLDDGKPAIVYECTHCHEQFTVSAFVEEDN